MLLPCGTRDDANPGDSGSSEWILVAVIVVAKGCCIGEEKKKNRTKGMRYQINRDMDFPFSRN